MGGQTPEIGTRPTQVRWMIFALGFGTSWLLYLHRYAFALIKPKLEEEYGWKETELGALDSAFFTFYMIFQVPVGVLTDVLGMRPFLAAMILLWSVVLALHAWAPSFTAMWGVRALFGATQAGAYPVLSRVTRVWFPLSVRTSVQGWIAVFAGRLGGASANLFFATVLIGVFLLSWRTSVYVFASGGVILALLVWLLFRDSPRRHPWVNEAEVHLIESGEKPEPARPRTSIAHLLQRMSWRSLWNVLALNLQSFLSTAADNLFVSWLPLFLSKVHGLKFKEMGIYSTLPLIGGAVGGAVGGYLNDWLLRSTGNRRWARRAVGLAGKGVAAAMLLVGIVFFYDRPYHFCGLLLFVKFFGDWSLSSSWGTVTDIGGRTTATVFAYNNTVAGVAAIVAPLVYGAVAEHVNWHSVFVLAASLYALCAVSWLLIDCTIPVLREDETESGTQGPAKA